LLGAKEVLLSHTGVNIAKKILMNEVPTSNNGTCNGTNGVDKLYSLQLAVEAALNVSYALAGCRRLVSHFHHSTKSMYMLQQKQIDLHHEQLCLVRDIPTRWNSAYYMAESVISM